MLLRATLAVALLLAAALAGSPQAAIVRQPPTGLTPARDLSPAQRRDNFEALWRAIDENYACFKLKSIDWDQIHLAYRQRLDAVSSNDDFYRLLFQLVNELHDTHSWLQNYRPPRPQFGPALALELFGGKPYVVAGPAAKLGSEILAIDDRTPAEQMEALRAVQPARSSERAFQRDAGHFLLAGERNTTVRVKLRAPDGIEDTLTLIRNNGILRPFTQKPPFPLTRQRFVHYGVHPSGLGYIQLESLNAHEEVAAEFDRALDALRTTPGLILDIRDDPGGFGQPRIVGRLLAKRTLSDISYIKNGPRHNDLARREGHLDPAGPWQYRGPIALLINDGTGSAADLLTCWIHSTRRATLIGTTTHGNLSGVATFAVLPCGLIVRISNGYICDSSNHPIEVRGNIPDIEVAPTVADLIAGRDPVLEKALSVLKTAP